MINLSIGSTKPVNIEAELGGTVRPDLEHSCVINGRQWFEFSAAYTDTESGRSYSLSFWALDIADAQRRIGCIRQNITVTGQIYATYPE